MKILSRVETDAWVRVLFSHQLDHHTLKSEFPCRTAYVLPTDCGKKTGLARALANLVDPIPPALFWITGHGIWPSSENPDLFNGYRSSLGEHRSLPEAPGHVFEKNDLLALQTLIAMSLYFFWDAYLIEGSCALVFRLSHDEFVDVYTKSKDRLNAIEEVLTKMELKRINDESHTGL
ncbi:MAG: hypothetical protein ACLPOO_18915 [Terriglobales bacterium]|jgi:hypothetical protein